MIPRETRFIKGACYWDVGDRFLQVLTHLEERADIHSIFNPHFIKHKHQVFCSDISGSARRKGTATQTADGGIERTNPRLIRGQGVSEP